MADDEAMDTTETFADHCDDLHSYVLARFRNSQSPEHRHLCAVVTAMADVIKEQALPSTPTAYFAATMSALERQCNDRESSMDEDSDEHVITALCTFLSIVLPKVSQAVLRGKGATCLALLVAVAGNDKASAGTLKHVFTCITALLHAADKSDWPRIAPSFNSLVKHWFNERPKVRKKAHECTAEVLSDMQGSNSLSMASEVIVTLFEQLFSSVNQVKQDDSTNKSSGKAVNKAALQILYLLNALKLLLPMMSGKSVGKVIMFFTKLLELKQAFLSRQILNTLQPFFANSTSEISSSILCDLLDKVAGIISEEKGAGDENMSAARILTSGMVKLISLDPKAGASKLPSSFQSIAGMLAFQQEEAVYAAADCLILLIEKCISESTIEQGKTHASSQEKSSNKSPSTIGRVCVIASSLLGYQYNSAWDVSLQVVAALFNKLGESSFNLMSDTIQTLADLEKLSDENLTCRKELHKTIGAAIGAMGPDKFLRLLPLKIDTGHISNARIWLLPILRQSIVGSELRYFSENLIPLIHDLQEESEKFSADGKPTTAKKADALMQSLWALFPSFCNYPSDTERYFGQVAKHLGTVLSEEPDLRGVICHGLQMLIRQNKSIAGNSISDIVSGEEYKQELSINKVAEERAKSAYTKNRVKANLAAIASYSRNFLPLLFNIFISSVPDKRGVLQDTIGDFASIADKKVVKDFFISIMQKLLKATKEAAESEKLKGADLMDLSGPSKEETISSRRCIFMDLALSLLHGLDDESVGVLFTAVKPTLQDADGAVQKKGYKVLAGLCKEYVGFLDKKADDILTLLLGAMPSCHFSAKRHRLSCLHPLVLHAFKSGYQNLDKVLSSFIGEIILATKESNIKTRNTAYEMLVQLGHSLKESDPDHLDGKMFKFFTMIVGCLGGTTPHMQSAAITGLARLIYEFNDLSSTVPDLLPSALLLLHTKSREVIKSVLGFLKVVSARQPVEHLQNHLKSMVEGLLLWSDDSKNHFKAKVRVIFEILVRRCGLQAVSAVTPEQHVKLISHIRKMKDRKERKIAEERQSVRSSATSARLSQWQHSQFFSDDEEEEADENMDVSTVAVTRKSQITKKSNQKLRKSNKMLPDDDFSDESGPLDLLDVQKTRSALSASKLKRKNYDSDDFEINEDGRLIVPDEGTARQRKPIRGGDENEDIDGRSIRSGKSSGGKVKSKVQNNKKRKTETGWAYTGDEYANKKGSAKGDVKRQGKLDPYAYWPLDPKMLNRRAGKKAAAQKGLASITQMTKKMKGLSASEALNLKQKKFKGKQKLHRGSKGKKR